MTVAEKSEEVPEIKNAVVQGELTLSQARRIATVITKQNHQEWIQKAKTLPQKELEREVTVVNPKAHVSERIRPVAQSLSELKVGVDDKTEANLTALQDILSQKLGRPATMAQVIAWMAEVTREKFDPVLRAKRSIAKAPVAKSSLKAEGSPREASPISSGNRKIPMSVRHPIILRDALASLRAPRSGRASWREGNEASRPCRKQLTRRQGRFPPEPLNGTAD